MTSKRGPRSGDDTYDLIDQALYQLAERRKAWHSDPIAAIPSSPASSTRPSASSPSTSAKPAPTEPPGPTSPTLATSPEQAELRYDPDSPVADARWPYDY